MKKISAADYNYIFNKKSHWSDRLCTFTIQTSEPWNSKGFTCRRQMKMYVYLIMLPIEAILQFFICLWDGGLKEWSLPDRPVETWHGYTCDAGLDGQYDRMKEIWEKG